MSYLIASEARRTLYTLIDEVAVNHEPTIIKGKRNTAVLLSEEDWEDIKETLFVASDKQLSDSLIKGKNTPYEECSTKLD
jgi:PHD/YefM family antitoxin component YafN of YafNO toxin-antitoxin module